MCAWKSQLRKDSTDWLLEKDQPSVRYFTLTDILDRSVEDPDVKAAKEEIMKTGEVPKILAKQKNKGYWGKPEDFYIRSKYKGTVWQFIILAELGANGRDQRIMDTCEFLLENSQDRETGGFSYMGNKAGGGDHQKVIPCLTANMVWSLIRFG